MMPRNADSLAGQRSRWSEDRFLNHLSALSQPSNAAERTPLINTPLSIREKLIRIAPEVGARLVLTFLVVSILFGTELYLHRKHGINFEGYRGPAVGQKQSGEKRIAVLGGSNVWGFGLKVGQDFPGQLQQQFAERSRTSGGAPIQILNLAYNAEGAYSFKYTLQDYDYLDCDVVLLYSGYDDLWRQNYFVSRHRSKVFLWTGYLPLLPQLYMEKIEYWGNRLTKGIKPVVVTPRSTNNTETVERTPDSSQNQLGSLTYSGQSHAARIDETCRAQCQFYCQQIYDATDLALKRGQRVLVVTEPYVSDQHVEQQSALEHMLSKSFPNQPRLRYLNLGRTINLQDRTLCWDGMHLTEEGNRRIAAALIQPVTELLEK